MIKKTFSNQPCGRDSECKMVHSLSPQYSTAIQGRDNEFISFILIYSLTMLGCSLISDCFIY